MLNNANDIKRTKPPSAQHQHLSISKQQQQQEDVVKKLTSKISNLLSTETKMVDDKTNSICSFTNCIERLNITKIRFHCRLCNGWYCAKHAGHPSFTILLDPITGQPSKASKASPSRVCELCFFRVVKPFPQEVVRRSHTEHFKELRKAARFRDKKTKEEILKRFENLKKLLLRDKKSPLRCLERSIVRWKDNSEMSACSCGSIFQTPKSIRTIFSFLAINMGLDTPTSKVLRHHCRACGTIICDDCSSFRKFEGIYTLLRICADCSLLLRDTDSPAPPPPTVPRIVFAQKFKELKAVERQIEGILPKFEEQMFLLEDGIQNNKKGAENLFLETKCSRETLILCFRHFEALAREIRDDQEYPESHELKKIKQGIYQYAITFLKDNMFPLKLMPKLAKKPAVTAVSAVSATATKTAVATPEPTATTTGTTATKLMPDFASSVDTMQTRTSVMSVFGKMAESLFNVVTSSSYGKSRSLAEELVEDQVPSNTKGLPSNIGALRTKALALRDQRGQLIIQISNPDLNDPSSLETLESSLRETEGELQRTRKIIRDCLTINK